MKFKKYISSAIAISLFLNICSLSAHIYQATVLEKKLNKVTQNIIILYDYHKNILDTRNFSSSLDLRNTKKVEIQTNKIIGLARLTRAQVLVESVSYNKDNGIIDFMPKVFYKFYKKLLSFVNKGLDKTFLLNDLHEHLISKGVDSFNI